MAGMKDLFQLLADCAQSARPDWNLMDDLSNSEEEDSEEEEESLFRG